MNALKGVSLKIEPGEFVAIMGPSGSGKSTLLHVLGLLDKPDSGEYFFMGKEVSHLSDDDLAKLRNGTIGFVFQQFHLLKRAPAIESVELPLIYAGKRELKDAAVQKLKDVGLESRKNHKPNELSGGEQQRVAIARALVNEPPVIFADEPTGNLDTKSEKEIMDILVRLNKEGKTIIMVTHENEVSEYAGRIIRMRDGDIISDEKKGDCHGCAIAAQHYSPDHFLEKISGISSIELIDHVRQSMVAIWANKVRSFLSVLGILIGVGSVIAMLALGQGAKESIEQRIKSLGSNLLSVRGGSSRMHGVAMGAGEFTRFTVQDADAIKGLSTVKSVSGYVSGKGQAVYLGKNWNTTIQGVGEAYGRMRASTPEIGRWFTEEEMLTREKVAIIGMTVLKEIFGDVNPIGKRMKINRQNFMVIGIMPEKGSGWHDEDDIILIPLTTAMYRVLGKDYLDGIYVEVNDPSEMSQAEDDVSALITRRHRLKDDSDTFTIRNMADIQQTLESTTKTMGLLLGCIAAISLIVGGIGIMNIMLVSVTERTKEIGLRKAIGARRKDILTQFMIEAVVMTLTGGIIGVIAGISVSSVITMAAGWATRVTVSNVIMAMGFCVVVGIFFGMWPAKKASELNPIDALRYE